MRPLFKTAQLEEQFYSQDGMDARLRGIILELADHLLRSCGKNLVVTEVRRTSERQKEIYGYLRPSRHLDLPCGAVDLRSRDLSQAEILSLQNWIEYWYGDWAVRLVHHDVGRGEHIHIQVPSLVDSKQ
jgi:hypothetical protein